MIETLENKIISELISKAQIAREFAYTPYSNFKVGASLLTAEGEIYTGCNIENAAYSPGNCAERTAVFKAVSEGKTNFKAIAIIAGMDEITDYTSPCGMCRQVLREFVNPKDFFVIMAKSTDDYKIMTLEELLPMSFGPSSIQ